MTIYRLILAVALTLFLGLPEIGIIAARDAQGKNQRITFEYGHGSETPAVMTIATYDKKTGITQPLTADTNQPGRIVFVYEDDGQFPTYHKDINFLFTVSKLQSDHSVKSLPTPLRFFVPVRFRSDGMIGYRFTFALYGDFTYETANKLDQLTSTIDLATRMVNSALGANFFKGDRSAIGANWARLWFDSAFLLARDRMRLDDLFGVDQEGFENFTGRVGNAERRNATSRFSEIGAAFLALDVPNFRATLSKTAPDCNLAKAILDEIESKNRTNPNHIRVAMPELPKSNAAGENVLIKTLTAEHSKVCPARAS